MVLHVVKTKKKQMAKRVKAARRAAVMGKAKLFPVPKTDVHPVIGLTSLGSNIPNFQIKQSVVNRICLFVFLVRHVGLNYEV